MDDLKIVQNTRCGTEIRVLTIVQGVTVVQSSFTSPSVKVRLRKWNGTNLSCTPAVRSGCVEMLLTCTRVQLRHGIQYNGISDCKKCRA